MSSQHQEPIGDSFSTLFSRYVDKVGAGATGSLPAYPVARSQPSDPTCPGDTCCHPAPPTCSISPPPPTAAVLQRTKVQAELGRTVTGTYCVVDAPTSTENNSQLLWIHQGNPHAWAPDTMETE